MLKLSRLPLALLALTALLSQAPSPAVAATPQVVAARWVIVDAETGTIMAGVDIDGVQPMASLTKVMTAVIALEHADLDTQVTVVEGDLVGESSAGLAAGEVVTLRTLLYGLLLKSGNDAAAAIARAVGGSPHAEDQSARDRFTAWMNGKAGELGLARSSFRNPHGLDELGHYSTPLDLARLTIAALRTPGFAEIFGAPAYSGDGHSYQHGNQLPGMTGSVVGGKTGWTDGCGLCLIEAVEIDGRTVVVVLMSSDWSWYDDAVTLVQYARSLAMPATDSARAAQVFARLWARTDKPVEDAAVARSWLWGPALGPVLTSPSPEAAAGWRYERLYEKGMMEINQPFDRMDTGWYVTPGRLAAQLLAEGALLAVAGDPDGGGPSYADLAAAPVQLSASETVTARLKSGEGVVHEPALAGYGVTAGSYAPETGVYTADVFDHFLGQTGTVLDGDAFVDAPLFQPALLVVGYPITDPYWLAVEVNGAPRDVLVQCFERRCLTYAPGNPAGWEVEMTNIGQHFAQWFEIGGYASVGRFNSLPHRLFFNQAP